MYCSHCGTGDQAPGSYCRRCGEWLAEKGRGGSGKPEDKMTVMAVFNGISSFFALFSAIALYATYLGRPEAKWSIYVAAAFCTVIAVHQAISFAFALQLRLRLKRGRAESRRAELQGAGENVPRLEGRPTGEIVDVPSVTEHTTELLPARKRERE
jgi:hypothetical protein